MKVKKLFTTISASLIPFFFAVNAFGEMIYSVPTAKNTVALTFDDGPSATTLQIIKVLADYGARATFFCTGENSERYPEILREVVRSGNEVGNHAYSHPHLMQTIEPLVCAEIGMTQNILSRITRRAPKVFRPPYSQIDPCVEEIALELGLKIIMWSVSPADWIGLDPSPETIAERVLSVIKAGDIVVMHDDRPNTVAALPLILKGLKRMGLEAVTVSELILQQ